jgi:hypothetical protein
VTRVATEDLTARRARLLQGFWSRSGVNETLATEAVECLRQSWPATVNELVTDELLAEVLQNFAVYPEWIERALTAVRRQFLFKDYNGLTSRALSHLAIQCHLNEYAWFEDAEESAQVEDWAGRVTSLTPDQVMALACYRPLGHITGSDALLGRGWAGPVQAVLLEQIIAVRREQALQARIPAVTGIGEGSRRGSAPSMRPAPIPAGAR